MAILKFLGEYQTGSLYHLPMDRISPVPGQPRKTFCEKPLAAMAASIREVGILHPVIVRLKRGSEDFFHLVAGERRLRAAQASGLTVIPAIVMRGTKRDAAIVSLIENVQRENLTPIEEGESYRRLKAEFAFTEVQLAQLVGKSQPTISEAIRLTRLPPTIKNACERNPGSYPKRMLVEISRHGTAEQMNDLFKSITEFNLTSDQVRDFVNREKRGGKRKKSPGKPPKTVVELAKSMTRQAEDLRKSLPFVRPVNLPKEVGGPLKFELDNLKKAINHFYTS